MMHSTVIRCLFLLVTTGTLLSIAKAQSDTTDTVPLCQRLYDEGYYDEAITLLDSLITERSCRLDQLFLLASCHIATGDTERGAQTFRTIFSCDSAYVLDTILTAPKILDVYRSAKREIDESNQDHDSSNLHVADTTVTAMVAHPPAKALALASPSPQIRYPVGLLPAGIPQLCLNRKFSAAFFFTAQTVALAGSVWAYNKREQQYDRRFGWFDGNEHAYRKYTWYSRIGIGIFLTTYSASIINYFYLLRQ